MSNKNAKIKIKHTGVPGAEPDVNFLEYGELAVNYHDAKIFYKDSENTLQHFDAAGSAASSLQGKVAADFLWLNNVGRNSLTIAFDGLTFDGDVTVNGNLTTGGSISSNTELHVDDIVLNLGDIVSPTDTSANSGGIVLHSDSPSGNKTFRWISSNGGANGAWTSNQDLNLLVNKSYYIDNSIALSKTALGSNVVSSSLQSVGTIGSGTWQATVIAGQYGGTGVNNNGKTITLSQNLAVSGSGSVTLNTTAGTSVTLPTSGTLATTTQVGLKLDKVAPIVAISTSTVLDSTYDGKILHVANGCTITFPDNLPANWSVGIVNYSGSGVITLAVPYASTRYFNGGDASITNTIPFSAIYVYTDATSSQRIIAVGVLY